MKKLILVLTLAFLFVSGSAFAATVNCIMYASENNYWISGTINAGPSITSDYYFTIETDEVTGDVVAFSDLLSNYFYAIEEGGWDPRDGASFIEGEQIFPSGERQSVTQIVFDGDTSGTTMWWRHEIEPHEIFSSLRFNCGIIGVNFDGTDGEVLFGPNATLVETYIFHAVPIPAAGWLLGSGFIGLVGFRRQLRKEL